VVGLVDSFLVASLLCLNVGLAWAVKLFGEIRNIFIPCVIFYTALNYIT
jgi:hypothetical protein